MAGLRVGEAFGMFLLPGFGVGSSSPWVPGHPTSMCDSGVNNVFTLTQHVKIGASVDSCIKSIVC